MIKISELKNQSLIELKENNYHLYKYLILKYYLITKMKTCFLTLFRSNTDPYDSVLLKNGFSHLAPLSLSKCEQLVLKLEGLRMLLITVLKLERSDQKEVGFCR